MEGGDATDGAGGTDETGQEEPKSESSPTSPAMTARSIEERNLPHKNTKGMDACASSYIMYGNVNKRSPVFAISICT